MPAAWTWRIWWRQKPWSLLARVERGQAYEVADRALNALARRKRLSRSDVVREALLRYGAQEGVEAGEDVEATRGVRPQVRALLARGREGRGGREQQALHILAIGLRQRHQLGASAATSGEHLADTWTRADTSMYEHTRRRWSRKAAAAPAQYGGAAA